MNNKELNNSLNQICETCDGILNSKDELSTNNSDVENAQMNFIKLVKADCNKIKNIVSTIEAPRPNCNTCLHHISSNSFYKPNDCKMKMMPKIIKKASNGSSTYGCIYHSEFW